MTGSESWRQGAGQQMHPQQGMPGMAYPFMAQGRDNQMQAAMMMQNAWQPQGRMQGGKGGAFPYQKPENHEFARMAPGEARTVRGYNNGPVSNEAQNRMRHYEEVMARPQGTFPNAYSSSRGKSGKDGSKGEGKGFKGGKGKGKGFKGFKGEKGGKKGGEKGGGDLGSFRGGNAEPQQAAPAQQAEAPAQAPAETQ